MLLAFAVTFLCFLFKSQAEEATLCSENASHPVYREVKPAFNSTSVFLSTYFSNGDVITDKHIKFSGIVKVNLSQITFSNCDLEMDAGTQLVVEDGCAVKKAPELSLHAQTLEQALRKILEETDCWRSARTAIGCGTCACVR